MHFFQYHRHRSAHGIACRRVITGKGEHVIQFLVAAIRLYAHADTDFTAGIPYKYHASGFTYDFTQAFLSAFVSKLYHFSSTIKIYNPTCISRYLN